MFANGPGDQSSIPSRVIPKTQKMILDIALLKTQHYKVQIKGKVEQSKKGVAPLPTPRYYSYWKGSLRVTLNCGCQLYITWLKQLKPYKITTGFGSIMVVGVLTHCALIHSVCNLKATQMNEQCSRIQEFIFYEFKLGNSTISCKHLDNQARSGRPKTMDFEVMFQAIEVNQANSTQKLLGQLHNYGKFRE